MNGYPNFNFPLNTSELLVVVVGGRVLAMAARVKVTSGSFKYEFGEASSKEPRLYFGRYLPEY